MNILILVILIINSFLCYSNNVEREIVGRVLREKDQSTFIYKTENKKEAKQFLFDNSLSVTQSKFDNSMKLIEMSSRIKSNRKMDIVDALNYDSYEIEFDKKRKYLTFNYKLNGNKTESKKVKVKKGFKVFDNLFYTLKESIKRGDGSFESLLIFPERGDAYRASFTQYRTKSIKKGTIKYTNIPDDFLEATNFTNEVVVYEVGLLGIASKFYPHKFNFVFSADKGNKFLAYWGGAPEDANYYYSYDKGDK